MGESLRTSRRGPPKARCFGFGGGSGALSPTRNLSIDRAVVGARPYLRGRRSILRGAVGFHVRRLRATGPFFLRRRDTGVLGGAPALEADWAASLPRWRTHTAAVTSTEDATAPWCAGMPVTAGRKLAPRGYRATAPRSVCRSFRQRDKTHEYGLTSWINLSRTAQQGHFFP